MTKLLYQTDSYLKKCSAEITKVVAEGVVLNQTVLYPGGGGQPCDIGVLTDRTNKRPRQVSGLKRIDGEIVHLCEMESELKAGESVEVEITWPHRYQLMRTHTAMHILCGVVWRDYGAQVTGGNMTPCRGRMDFEFEKMQAELVHEIEQKINAEVQATRPVQVKILPRNEAFQIPDLIRTKINLLPPHIAEVRTVEIVGLDLQADGGTHVANTSEVGPMRIIEYKSKGRINKRLVVELEP
ncbi:alanyl-tRNA editing protein [candidate division KSB1 bacterium]|nr:alanyl-tRNA editing protein [candidate division KSB1 bacterium]